MMDVQKESGGYDCGLFVIAFATALARLENIMFKKVLILLFFYAKQLCLVC